MHSRHRMIAAAISMLAMVASAAACAASRPPLPAGHGKPPAQQLMAYCDPFGYPWNDTPVNDDVPDDGDQLRARGGHGTATMPAFPMPGPADAAAMAIGRSPEEIDRNFVEVVTRNLENGGAASRIARLSDHELAAIASVAGRASAPQRAGLLKVLARRLDADSLVRVAAAFGRGPVAAAVDAYASSAVRAGFARNVTGLASGGTGGGGSGPGPSPAPPRPTPDMTLREIYLEYRTAPVGSLSPAASLAETAMFAGRYLRGPAATGTIIGTAIHYLIEEFAPGLDDAIGGTIGAMLDNFWTASTQFEQGHFESAFDSLFGFPVTWSSDSYGDWDISAPMMFYYQSASTCGW